MGFYRYSKTILNVTEATDQSADGSQYSVGPDDGDPLKDNEQGAAVLIHLEISGGTNPTADVMVEGSEDGTHWATLASLGQITSGFKTEIKTLTVVPSRLRARSVLGGDVAASHKVRVALLSNGPMRTSVVS